LNVAIATETRIPPLTSDCLSNARATVRSGVLASPLILCKTIPLRASAQTLSEPVVASASGP
jgi:hypothetical protein